jgi:hypothetical protein
MPESRKVPAILCYQRPPHVVWTVERKGILLLDQHSGAVLRLEYPQAAVWDLLHKKYEFDQMIRMLSVIAAMDTGRSKQLLVESLTAWTQAGFLNMKTENG